MKIVVFVGVLGIGGTEKAACRWSIGLQTRGHEVLFISFKDGPRRAELIAGGVKTVIIPPLAVQIATEFQNFRPDLIHAHVPGYPHPGDVLGEALTLLPKIPVVQTNVFGRLENPKEDAWTDFRMFISWTSCVQAARRSFCKLDENFFRRASVAVYPLDPVEPPPAVDIGAFRKQIGAADNEVLFGRLSRPEPNKWTNLALDAFRLALRRNRKMRLLLREPPPLVAAELRASSDADRFVILPATSDAEELRLTMSALDAVLHTSSIGESFGYGIAEPMNLGKPVITHSVPWADQAQIELTRHGECGFIASTPKTMARAILRLVEDPALLSHMGQAAQQHVRFLTNAEFSISRIEKIFETVLVGRENPFGAEDLVQAKRAALYLDEHQFGETIEEQFALRPRHYRARFHQWRKHPNHC